MPVDPRGVLAMGRVPRVLIALAALALVAACGDDGGQAASSDDGVSGEETAEVWEEHLPGGDCQCADGSEFRYFSRDADPDKVLLYFQGGGACFSAESCSFTDGSYFVQADADLADTGEQGPGIFDFTNDDNPFRDHSVVFVPYCTGDVHLGNAVQTYGDDLTVNHVGFLNASKGLDHVVENYPDVAEVVVAGSSAGGIPSPLFGGLVSDELPAADVTVLADASGGYPDNPAVNVAIGSLWGAYDNVPDWPVNEDLSRQEWSIPGFFVQTGLHAPEVRMARYDNAYDETQQQFSQLSGIGSGDVLTVLDSTEADIEAAGVPLRTYVAPGTDHTILTSDALYELEVEGVPFLDWLTRYLAGEDVEDVRCVDCGEPAAGDPDDLLG
jgi:hypothetical protein